MLTDHAHVDEKCPKCGSTNVEVTSEVSACLACGWTLMGETPCDTCGEPSVGCYSAGGPLHHYCREHFPEQDRIFQEMANAMVQARAD